MPPSIYIVRHGKTALNGEGSAERYRGWSNPSLNEEGQQDAQAAAGFLKDKGIAHVFASDLLRAVQTGRAISQATGAPLTPMHGLRPVNVGDYTGKSVDKHRAEMDSFFEHPDQQIPGGERVSDFRARLGTTMSHLAMFSHQHNATIAVVTHTSDVEEINRRVKGRLRAKEQPPGGIVRMDFGPKGPTLTDINPGVSPTKDSPGAA